MSGVRSVRRRHQHEEHPLEALARDSQEVEGGGHLPLPGRRARTDGAAERPASLTLLVPGSDRQVLLGR